MNAQAITDKIIDDARADAAKTLREAREKASLIHQKADEAAEQKRAQAQQTAERQVEELRERMLRMAELEQKKQLLKVKREVVDEVFEDALERMMRMPADRKRTFIERLMVEASEDGEQVIVSGEDRALYSEAFMARLSDALRAAGKKPVVLAREIRPMDGGFVLKRGGMEINCTFRAVLGQMRPSLEAPVAQMLFADK